MLTTTQRKIEALHDIIKQIEQKLGPLLVDDLNNDPVVLSKNKADFLQINLIQINIDIMEKWNRLQTTAHNRDERLKDNRKQWNHFKRQLEDLEQALEQLTNTDHSCN